MIAAGGDTVETEKRLGAILCEGATIVALDNCSRDIEGDALAQYVERPRGRVRKLGASEAPRLENRAIVSVTGNNVGPKGDMVRRNPDLQSGRQLRATGCANSDTTPLPRCWRIAGRISRPA